MWVLKWFSAFALPAMIASPALASAHVSTRQEVRLRPSSSTNTNEATRRHSKPHSIRRTQRQTISRMLRCPQVLLERRHVAPPPEQLPVLSAAMPARVQRSEPASVRSSVECGATNTGSAGINTTSTAQPTVISRLTI